jgi:hypothetical protein
MPIVQKTAASEVAEALKPYVQHGMDLSIGGKEATADCPFCGREGKFSIDVNTGMWRCFVCAGGMDSGGGGIVKFLELLHDTSEKETTVEDYKAFATERGLEYPETLMSWRLAKSVLNGQWLIPGWTWNAATKQLEFSTLYLYGQVFDGKGETRNALLVTAGRPHALLGLNLFDEHAPDVFICEGPWDGMRLWETMRTVKVSEGEYKNTAPGSDSSLIKGVSVLAAATCSAFPKKNTNEMFKNKIVCFMYDSDHPLPHPRSGDPLTPAGYAGMQRDAAKVSSTAAEVRYLHWGDTGYAPELPNGYDVRDALQDKLGGLPALLNRVHVAPDSWLEGKPVGVHTGTELVCRKCHSWEALRQSWRKAMKFTDGLDHALACMLASVVSTDSIGDQLWLKILGPASCGKSTLCEALAVNKKYVFSKSSIRGFHSGYQTDRQGQEDNSLLTLANHKTLVTKDGDTLLQAPNLGQILAEARDIYDGTSRTHYRNKMSKDYEGLRMTWILCGTASLRAIDNSELGERFLDCVVMEKIEDELEDEILWRTVNYADAQVGIEANGDLSTHYSPEKLAAYELTGGYIDWLKENASRLLPTISMPDWTKQQCMDIGKFVAHMRARPSEHQKESAERELAARLVSQHTRLAKCLGLVLNQPQVTDEVMRRTRQVGLDTSRGIVLKITRHLYRIGAEGMSLKAIALNVNEGDSEVNKLLRFMRSIDIVKRHADSRVNNSWILTDRMRKLYTRVMKPVKTS